MFQWKGCVGQHIHWQFCMFLVPNQLLEMGMLIVEVDVFHFYSEQGASMLY